MPGVVAGLLLVFIPLTGDYITAAVLGGAKGNMVGALVASQFSTAQNWALGSAMAVILILMILGGGRLLRRDRSGRARPDPTCTAGRIRGGAGMSATTTVLRPKLTSRSASSPCGASSSSSSSSCRS